MKVWPVLQDFLQPIEQAAVETAYPIVQGAVDKVFQENPSLNPFEAIANVLLQSAAALVENLIHPNAAVAAATHAVNAKHAGAQQGGASGVGASGGNGGN
jgi:uncharacterized membrane protein